MYPDAFDYERADTVEEAIDLLEEHAMQETELLAGGHSLLPTMKSGLASPDVLIDISGIESMKGITDEGDHFAIGAMSTYAAITDDDRVWNGATALAEATGKIGDVQVRNKGTIGGNLAHADPASDLPGAALSTDLDVVLQGPAGERTVNADDFFFGMYMTDVGEDEILTRIEVPKKPEAVGAYAKKPSPSSGYAMIGVAVTLEAEGGVIQSASVGANGIMDHGVRLDPVEDALEGERMGGEAFEAAAERATDDLDEAMMMEDLQASAEFRAQLLKVYTRRALERAAERADSPGTGDSAAAAD